MERDELRSSVRKISWVYTSVSVVFTASPSATYVTWYSARLRFKYGSGSYLYSERFFENFQRKTDATMGDHLTQQVELLFTDLTADLHRCFVLLLYRGRAGGILAFNELRRGGHNLTNGVDNGCISSRTDSLGDRPNRKLKPNRV
eukprot:1194573-Prorocentrum_minimum.AAC.7